LKGLKWWCSIFVKLLCIIGIQMCYIFSKVTMNLTFMFKFWKQIWNSHFVYLSTFPKLLILFSKIEIWTFLIYIILYSHNLLKNWTVVKNPHTNTNNVLTIKFHNRSIHCNLETNGDKRILLSVNLVSYALVRRRQRMTV